jgi:hypothetical protein
MVCRLDFDFKVFLSSLLAHVFCILLLLLPLLIVIIIINIIVLFGVDNMNLLTVMNFANDVLLSMAREHAIQAQHVQETKD